MNSYLKVNVPSTQNPSHPTSAILRDGFGMILEHFALENWSYDHSHTLA